MTERDDEAWRAIVENYGERPSLDDEAGDSSAGTRDGRGTTRPDAPQPEGSTREAGQETGPEAGEDSTNESATESAALPSSAGDEERGEERPREDPDAVGGRALAEEERFVPPPAPPLPYVAPSRLAAGLGVLGAPLVLLIAVVGGISIPGWLGYLMVAWFVGGFVYLVLQMKKRPDDPWDDGARV